MTTTYVPALGLALSLAQIRTLADTLDLFPGTLVRGELSDTREWRLLPPLNDRSTAVPGYVRDLRRQRGHPRREG